MRARRAACALVSSPRERILLPGSAGPEADSGVMLILSVHLFFSLIFSLCFASTSWRDEYCDDGCSWRHAVQIMTNETGSERKPKQRGAETKSHEPENERTAAEFRFCLEAAGTARLDQEKNNTSSVSSKRRLRNRNRTSAGRGIGG
jgi:hypothetical protein